MAKSIHVDVSDAPELLRLAEEVQATNMPRVLSRGSEPIAVVTPIRRRRAKRAVSKEDYDAFLASAGGWKGNVHVDGFLRDNEESRRISTRPPVVL
jgi:hypothetical protein